MKLFFSTVFWILTITAISSAQTTLYYPQIANGQQGGGISWVTWILITNSGTSPTSGSILFTQDNGTPFNISFFDADTGNQPGGSGNIILFQLEVGQTRIYLSSGAGPLTVGFGTLSSGSRVTSTAVFSEYGFGGGPGAPGGLTGGLIAEASVPAVTASMQQATFFYVADKFDSAVALVNTGASTADITLQILDGNGAVIAPPVAITLPANNHTAKYVSQLFPSAVGHDGTMQIISSMPLAGVALRFSSSGAFTTLPVFLASLLNPAWEWLDQRPWLTPLHSLAKLLKGSPFTIG